MPACLYKIFEKDSSVTDCTIKPQSTNTVFYFFKRSDLTSCFSRQLFFNATLCIQIPTRLEIVIKHVWALDTVLTDIEAFPVFLFPFWTSKDKQYRGTDPYYCSQNKSLHLQMTVELMSNAFPVKCFHLPLIALIQLHLICANIRS